MLAVWYSVELICQSCFWSIGAAPTPALVGTVGALLVADVLIWGQVLQFDLVP